MDCRCRYLWGLAFLAACAPAADTGADEDTATPSGLGIDDGPVEDPFDRGIHDFTIDIDEAGLASLAKAPRDDVPGQVTYGGETWTAGVRLKGNTSFRDLSEKASFKIDFHEYDDDARWYGRKRVTLNNMIQDPTMSSENLSYALHTAMGNPAPMHGYARVTVNGDYFGLYSVIETVDDDFLERLFVGDDEGNLYEGGYGGDFNNGCDDLFDQKEGDDESLQDLELLIEEVEASTPKTIEALLEERFDLDGMMSVWAVELVTLNSDAYTTLANNFFVYHALKADRWTMIPWGPDQAWHGDEPLPKVLDGALAERCWEAPSCQARMKAHVEAVLDEWDAIDFSAFALEDINAIEQDCREDPRSDWGDYGCRDKIEELRGWVSGRTAEVRSQLVDW